MREIVGKELFWTTNPVVGAPSMTRTTMCSTRDFGTMIRMCATELLTTRIFERSSMKGSYVVGSGGDMGRSMIETAKSCMKGIGSMASK